MKTLTVGSLQIRNVLSENLLQYLKEVYYLKNYIITSVIVLLLSYSVYLFFDESTVARMGEEDQLFENLSCVNFLAGCLIFFMLFRKTKNFFFLLLSIMLLIGFGEEISWGQRIFKFSTPDYLILKNEQEEFNFHNIWTWEINFIFKCFTILFGIILPIMVFHFKAVSRITIKLKLPVPPVSIGIFFLLDWVVFRAIILYTLPPNRIFEYYASDTEIYEYVTSFILVLLSNYFYLNRNLLVSGMDIKDQLKFSLPAKGLRVIPGGKKNINIPPAQAS